MSILSLNASDIVFVFFAGGGGYFEQASKKRKGPQ